MPGFILANGQPEQGSRFYTLVRHLQAVWITGAAAPLKHKQSVSHGRSWIRPVGWLVSCKFVRFIRFNCFSLAIDNPP